MNLMLYDPVTILRITQSFVNMVRAYFIVAAVLFSGYFEELKKSLKVVAQLLQVP